MFTYRCHFISELDSEPFFILAFQSAQSAIYISDIHSYSRKVIVYPVEPFIYLVKSFVYYIKSLIDIIESVINLFDRHFDARKKPNDIKEHNRDSNQSTRSDYQLPHDFPPVETEILAYHLDEFQEVA